MKKKIVSQTLACIIALLLLGGCAGQAASGTAQGTGQAATGTGGSGKIRVEVFDRGTDGGKTSPTDNFYTQWIQKKVKEDLNIDVEFVSVSRWEEVEQLNNRMAAGNAPDVCMTYDENLVANYREMGGLSNIAPYIDTELKDLKDFLGEDKAAPGRELIYREQYGAEKNVYALRARRMNTAAVNTFVRKDWLDALGMQPPTTTEEFYEMLKAFKEKDPGKVGKENVVPFLIGTRDVRWRAKTLLDSFIDPNLSEQDRWVNTVVDREFLLPGYKDGMQFLNKLYNEGLTDKEFTLHSDDTDGENMLKSGMVGAFIHNWDQPYRDTPGIYRDLETNVPGAEFIAVDCFKNAAGVTYKGAYDTAGLYIFVPSTSQNAEAAVRYINWMAKFDNRYFLQVGEEGVTHEMLDGVPKIIPATGSQIMNSALNIDYTFVINGLDVGDAQKNLTALSNSYNVAPELILQAYEDSSRNAKPIMVLPGVSLTAAGPVSQTLIDKGWTLMAESVTTKPENFDKVWEAGLKDWMASGAQSVIDERTAKLAEQNAK